MLKRHAKWISFLAILLMLSLVACSAFVSTTYKAGAISKYSWKTAVRGMGELYDEGLISYDVKKDVLKYGELYRVAHNNAMEALARYAETKDVNQQQAYLQFASDASNALADLLNYCRPYLLKHGKEIP